MKSDIVIGKKIIHIFYTKTTSEQKEQAWGGCSESAAKRKALLVCAFFLRFNHFLLNM